MLLVIFFKFLSLRCLQAAALICQLELSSTEELSVLPYYCIIPTARCLIIHHLAYQELFIYQKDLREPFQSSSVDYQQKIDIEMSLNKVRWHYFKTYTSFLFYLTCHMKAIWSRRSGELLISQSLQRSPLQSESRAARVSLSKRTLVINLLLKTTVANGQRHAYSRVWNEITDNAQPCVLVLVTSINCIYYWQI